MERIPTMMSGKRSMLIRSAHEGDNPAWERMRQSLWPTRPSEHAGEIEQYFAGQLRGLLEVLMAFDDWGKAIGFVELSIRAYVEGCVTDHVAYIEGLYVEPRAIGKGIGAALIQAAESWARAQGCTEIASDTEVDNTMSAAAHRSIGFIETGVIGVIRCFKKAI